MKKAMRPIAWKRDGWMRLEEDLLIATLSDEGTIRGASRKLYISQPALSQRLKQIEQRFGEPLFIRTHKSLIPTPVGEEVIAFAKRRVQEEKQLQDRLSKLTGTVRGTLSLGISSVIAQYVLPKPLRAYVNAYPDVKIDLHTGLSSAIYQNRHHTHLSIIRGDVDDKEGLTLLFSERLYYVRRADTEKPTVFISFQSDDAFQSLIEEWLYAEAAHSPLQTITVDQIETCKQLMANGIGAAILPEVAVRDLNGNDYIRMPLDVNGKETMRSTWLHCPESHRSLPQVNAFITFLQGALPPSPLNTTSN